ncbi:DUF6163 family protein [Bartonella doshiae]|uniref:DUF6163 family protein n=1 Tax=Bartonella doshiae TaxID=33044 RepID=UPI00094593F1|nr:DUF6163 family protein [Bartonella doshiae]
MTNNPQKQTKKINLIYNYYLRFLALICLGLSVLYWIRLVGVFPGELWRFDLMPWRWQFLSATLAIIYPIALIGLWMYSPWGIILWCIAALTETIAICSFNFVYQPFMLIFHGMLFLVLITLQIIMMMISSKKSYNG